MYMWNGEIVWKGNCSGEDMGVSRSSEEVASKSRLKLLSAWFCGKVGVGVMLPMANQFVLMWIVGSGSNVAHMEIGLYIVFVGPTQSQ